MPMQNIGGLSFQKSSRPKKFISAALIALADKKIMGLYNPLFLYVPMKFIRISIYVNYISY